MSELVLGTAQFGLDYGIANMSGQLDFATVSSILAAAKRLGVRWLDTAHAYGDSESVLGRAFKAGLDFRVCTKIGAGLDGADDPLEALGRQLNSSLHRLGLERVDILLMHDAGLLLGRHGDAVAAWLDQLKRAGVVGAWGASVYASAEARGLLERHRPDWVQLPCNVLDQRLLEDGTLEALRARGVKVQVRSALLQGLLLADPSRLPDELAAAREPLLRLRDAAREQGATPLALALAFVDAQPAIDQVVLGALSTAQLEECALALQACGARTPCREFNDRDWSALGCKELAIVDPRCWPKGLRIAA